MTEENRKLTADRSAERAMGAICVLNLCFFVMFALSVFQVAQARSAEVTACTGQNLLTRLAEEHPDRLAAAREEAEVTLNGRSILWRISGRGTEPSWLFGTMHSADRRIARLEGDALQAFDTSSTVLIESTETLESANMAKTMMELRDLTLLMDGSLLEQSVADDRLEDLRGALEARGMPWKIANHMQPWLVAAAIAAPDCEFDAKNAGLPVLDTLIGTRAQEAGKTLVGLETIEEQFAAIASVPREFHVNALNETLRLHHLLDDMHETTKQLYMAGDMAMVLPLARAYALSAYRGKGHAEFQERVLSKRNHLMARRAIPHLKQGGVFMAVGALHLSGEDGLVQLLRQHGFDVTAFDG